MKGFLILFVIVGIFSIGHSQSSADEKDLIGFACYYDGIESKPVKKVSRLINKSKFKAIIRLLDSENNAEKYLAVIVVEKLNALGKITLTEELNIKILKIYNSEEEVFVCSGCTYFDKLTLKTLFNKENEMRISANYWIEYNFKKK